MMYVGLVPNSFTEYFIDGSAAPDSDTNKLVSKMVVTAALCTMITASNLIAVL